MKKKNQDRKLSLNKKTIASLHPMEQGKIEGGAFTNDINCMTPPYTIPFQTVCCKSWPPACSQLVSCIG